MIYPFSEETIVNFRSLCIEQTHSTESTRKAPKPSRPGWQSWFIGTFVIMAAGSIFALLADEIWEREGFGWDAPIMLAIHLPAIFIPLSRVYLGVHYPSDILGAVVLGIAWMSVVLLLLRVVAMHTQDFRQFNLGILSRLACPNSRARKGDSLS